MEQKFFFFDVDNTLAVWPDGVIPDSAKYALEGLVKKGHRIALATGRLQADAMRFAEEANTPDFVADGGYSITVDYEVKWMQGMDRDTCIAYLHQLTDKGLPWAITETNSLERLTPYESILDWHVGWDIMTTKVVPDLTPEKVKHFYKVFAYMTMEEEKQKGVVHMSDKLIRYGDSCVLFEPMEKAVGVRKMMDYYKMDYSQAVVFGDGYNDLSMFSPEWFKVAMENGRDALKEQADYIAKPCYEDGIYETCKHFGWID